MSEVTQSIRWGVNFGNLISGLDLGSKGFFRFSTATSQAIQYIRATTVEGRHLVTALTGIPAVMAGLGRVGAGLAGAIGQSHQEFQDFTRQMFLLEFQGGVTGGQLERFEQRIRDVSLATGLMPAEIANIARALSAAGIAADQTLDALQPIALFAAGFGGRISPEKAADLAVVAWNKFGKEVGSIEGIMDRLVRVTQISTLNAEDLLSLLRTMGATHILAPNQLSTLLAFAAAMSNTGLTAAQAADDMRIFMEQFIRFQQAMFAASQGSNRMSARLRILAGDALDLDRAFDSEGNFQEWLKTVDDVVAAMSGLNNDMERERILATALRTQGGLFLKILPSLSFNVGELGTQFGYTANQTLQGLEVLRYFQRTIDASGGSIARMNERLAEQPFFLQQQTEAASQLLAVEMGRLGDPTIAFWKRLKLAVFEVSTELAQATGWAGKFLVSVAFQGGHVLSWAARLSDSLATVVFGFLSLRMMQKQLLVLSDVKRGAQALPLLTAGGAAASAMGWLGKALSLRGLAWFLGGAGVLGIIATFLPAIIDMFRSKDTAGAPERSFGPFVEPLTGYPAPRPGTATYGAAPAYAPAVPGAAPPGVRSQADLNLNLDGRPIWEGSLEYNRRNDVRDIYKLREQR